MRSHYRYSVNAIEIKILAMYSSFTAEVFSIDAKLLSTVDMGSVAASNRPSDI